MIGSKNLFDSNKYDMIIILIVTATGIPNGDAAAQAALQQAYPTIPYPGIGKYIYVKKNTITLFIYLG